MKEISHILCSVIGWTHHYKNRNMWEHLLHTTVCICGRPWLLASFLKVPQPMRGGPVMSWTCWIIKRMLNTISSRREQPTRIWGAGARLGWRLCYSNAHFLGQKTLHTNVQVGVKMIQVNRWARTFSYWFLQAQKTIPITVGEIKKMNCFGFDFFRTPFLI